MSLRLPLLERYARLPKGRTRRLFVVAGRSADGIEVRLSGELVIQIVDPVQAVEVSLAPTDHALDEAERVLARVVACTDVVSLADSPTSLELALDVPGVRVTDLHIDRVEIELTPTALQAVVDQTK